MLDQTELLEDLLYLGPLYFKKLIKVFHQYNQFPLDRPRGYACGFPHNRNSQGLGAYSKSSTMLKLYRHFNLYFSQVKVTLP